MTIPLAGPQTGVEPTPTRHCFDVLLVTSPGCHFCHEARDTLRQLGASFHLKVREIDLASDEGRAALRQWPVPFPPILVIDGELFGYGRISGRRLLRHLEARSTEGRV